MNVHTPCWMAGHLRFSRKRSIWSLKTACGRPAQRAREPRYHTLRRSARVHGGRYRLRVSFEDQSRSTLRYSIQPGCGSWINCSGISLTKFVNKVFLDKSKKHTYVQTLWQRKQDDLRNHATRTQWNMRFYLLSI